jgi:spore germination cell wall hydrolase CwlJ-like protein
MTFFVSSSDIKLNSEFQKLRDINVVEGKPLSNETISNQIANKLNVEHLKCLAANIYYEARGEPFLGQVLVARVVMNRIDHGFASNPCKVVYQSRVIQNDSEDGVKKVCQFSWVCEGKDTPPKNSYYKQAEEIARKVLLENKWKDIVPTNILFFHATYVDPNWKYKKEMTVGNHVFYSYERE